MQLAATFRLSPLEPAELCLLWNLIRFPVRPSCSHHPANNSVQMTPEGFTSDTLPPVAPLTSSISWARGPREGNYGTSQLHFLPSRLLFTLSAAVPRKIFSPMSERHHAGNWCCSRSMKPRMYCSLDTSCGIAWLLIVDWSITTCSILCVARLVLVAHHSFS